MSDPDRGNPGLPVLTNDFARQIEDCIAPVMSPAASADDPNAPVVVRFGSTIASKARAGKPANKVFCFGTKDVARLDDILSFYEVDGLEPWFYLSPMRFSRAVAEALTARGFAQREFQQAILYGSSIARPIPAPSGVTIERVDAGNLDEFAHVTAEGFEWPPEWRAAAMDEIRRKLDPGSPQFLARVEGEPAGAGGLEKRGNWASLVGGAVVPRFRGRGCHLALVRHRLHQAHLLGHPIVKGAADFGSGSFRNQHRAGLQLAYIESAWARQ